MRSIEWRLKNAQKKTRDWALGKDVRFKRVPELDRSDSKLIRITKRARIEMISVFIKRY